jgi:hypothetical protein
MLKKTWVRGALLFSATLLPFGAAQAQPVPPGQPTEFTLMMWGAAPGTPAQLKRVQESGLNVAGFATPAQLDAVQAAGLKAFIWPEWEDIPKLIKDKKISEHPALSGFLLGSEFPATQFEEIGKWAELCKREMPTKIPLMNLLPTLDQPATLERIDKFIATSKPTVLCYDKYAMMEDGTVESGYWECLKVTRAKSQANKIPFWNVVQASGHMDYREPTEADFRFQAFTTLAYGGRGIVYFTYTAFPVGNYRGAPVDQYGHETPAWQYLQNTNKQVLALAPYAMKMHSDEVYHFGEVPSAGQSPSEKSLIKSLKGNFLVGDFTHEDGNRYVMIVNKDLQKSRQCWPVFRDESITKVERVSVYRAGELTALNDEERYLAPGQGMLLKLNIK